MYEKWSSVFRVSTCGPAVCALSGWLVFRCWFDSHRCEFLRLTPDPYFRWYRIQPWKPRRNFASHFLTRKERVRLETRGTPRRFGWSISTVSREVSINDFHVLFIMIIGYWLPGSSTRKSTKTVPELQDYGDHSSLQLGLMLWHSITWQSSMTTRT